MEKENQQHPNPPKRSNIIYDMTLGAIVGAVGMIGIKLGWKKISGWANGVKPSYSSVFESSALLGSATGGALGGAYAHSEFAEKDKAQLKENNLRLQHEVELLKLEKNYAEQIAAQKAGKIIQFP